MVSYYAHLNNQNVVTQVVTGVDENETIEDLPAVDWYTNFTGVKNVVTYIDNPNKIYAGIGFTYDETTQNFIPPINEPVDE